MTDLFKHPIMTDILIALAGRRMKIREIERELRTPAYGSILQNVKELEVMELCSTTKEGSSRYAVLTNKGELVARLLKQVKVEI